MTITSVILAGPSSVGKTTIVARLNNHNVPQVQSTIGCAFGRAKIGQIDSPGGEKMFDIWDTAGQERYMAMTPMYFRKADIVLFVFDVADLTSIQQLGEFIKLLFATRADADQLKYIFIGNKIDRDHLCEDALREHIRNIPEFYINQMRDVDANGGYFDPKSNRIPVKIIFMSALQNIGLDPLRNLLVEYAKPDLTPVQEETIVIPATPSKFSTSPCSC